MSKLITKNELFKLGFKIFDLNNCILFIYCEKNYYITVSLIMRKIYFNNAESDFCILIKNSTKANVLKLIEIAKLMGELE